MNTEENPNNQQEEIQNETNEPLEGTNDFFPSNEEIENPDNPQDPETDDEEENEGEEEEEDDEEEPEPKPEPKRITEIRKLYPTINEFYLTTDNLIFLSYRKKEALEHQKTLGQGEISIY